MKERTQMTSDTPKTSKKRISRTTKAAASRAGGLVSSARDLAGQVGAVSATLAETFPDAADAVKGGARDAYRTVETMPKSQQRTLTRASLGIGAALFILGAPRILTLLAFLPAAAVAGMKLAKRAA
jgi:TRAP-type mannitol/chloroaromatic compound transport system substrate-binding protein